jgi:tetratricopeptide (TPR) repeat protein
MDLFGQVIRLDQQNDAAHYELAQLYYQNKKFNDALHFARTAAQLKPSNDWYQLLLADICMNTGRMSEAVSIHEKLVKTNPNRVEYYFNWANALMFSGKLEDAIKVFDMAEQKIGIERDLIVQKERMYLKLGKIDKAAAEVEKLIKAFPTDMGAYSLLVELYQANGMNEKVLETVERMKKVNPSDPHVYLALAEYYRSIKENEKSFEQLKLAFRSPDLDSEIKMRILSSYLPLIQLQAGMLEQALELSAIYVEIHPEDAMGHAVFGDFLNMDKKTSQAAAEYRTSLDLDKSNEQVWQQYLINLSELRDTDKMMTDSEEALSLFPNNPIFYFLNGIAKYDKKRYSEAAETFLTGSKMVVDNNLLLVDFYSRLGDTYHELKNHEESDKHYEKALALDPKNAFVLNNYSYYLALRKEKLEKAESMSKLSNDLMPNQSSFLDTYAWVLYQMGRYQDAKVWIEKAIEHNGSTSGSILEHYGDILFRLNNTSEALIQWKKAKEAGGASDWIDKKIADQKLYE